MHWSCCLLHSQYAQFNNTLNKQTRVRGKTGTALLPGSTEVMDRRTGRLVPCNAERCPHGKLHRLLVRAPRCMSSSASALFGSTTGVTCRPGTPSKPPHCSASTVQRTTNAAVGSPRMPTEVSYRMPPNAAVILRLLPADLSNSLGAILRNCTAERYGAVDQHRAVRRARGVHVRHQPPPRPGGAVHGVPPMRPPDIRRLHVAIGTEPYGRCAGSGALCTVPPKYGRA